MTVRVLAQERRDSLRREAESYTGFKRPFVFVDPKELLQLLDESDDLAAYCRSLERSVAKWERIARGGAVGSTDNRADLERATEKLKRHAFPITLEPLEAMEDEKTLSRDEARAVVDALSPGAVPGASSAVSVAAGTDE